MARKLAQPPSAPQCHTGAPPGTVRLSRAFRVMTPLYGGGVAPGKHDLTAPIRETSIRGHLRFWWRLACGSGLSAQELYQREMEIWGSAENTSPVMVHVSHVHLAVERERLWTERSGPFGFDRMDSQSGELTPETYALFPPIESKAPAILREGIDFRLTITWPADWRLKQIREAENRQRAKEGKAPLGVSDLSDDVNRAMAAWVQFGGLGARTRRGLGVVTLGRPDADLDVGDSGLNRPIVVPKMQVFVGKNCGSNPEAAMLAWRNAVDVYRRFRQGFRNNNRQGRQGRGRTRWPEPDSIRNLTNCPSEPGHKHVKPVVCDDAIGSFPRAVLGLPIIFHFAGDGPGKGKSADPACDPADVQLLPHLADNPKADRMASPIITKPMWFNGNWYPAVVILPHNHALVIDARLEGKPAKWNTQHRRAEDLNEVIPNDFIVGPHLTCLDPLKPEAENAIQGLIQFLHANPDFRELSNG